MASSIESTKRIRLHFKCKNLADMDTFSKSDPYIVLYDASKYQQQQTQQKPPSTHHVPLLTLPHQQPSSSSALVAKYGREIGRTEIIMNNLNPIFTQPIEIQFFFEAQQFLNVVVFDYDGDPDDSKSDICGVAQFQLSHIICSVNGKREFPLQTVFGGKGNGGQSVKGSVEVSFSDMATTSSRDNVKFSLRGEQFLTSMGGLLGGGLKPFFTLSRLQPNGTQLELYRSEVATNGAQPKWAVTKPIKLSELYASSKDEPTLVFNFFTKKGLFGGGATGMGSYTCSLSELLALHKSSTPFLPRKAKNTAKHYGDVYVHSVEVSEFPTFLQCISGVGSGGKGGGGGVGAAAGGFGLGDGQIGMAGDGGTQQRTNLVGGWQINMALSIDFTGSNGDPRSPTSLHFMNPRNPNQYVAAMMSVGEILMEYDTDKQIPVYGFGASFKGSTSHFFNVNMLNDPYVDGIQGALDAYGRFLPTAMLSGPTNFAPTIRAVTEGARAAEKDRVYTILLIITDGEITDMRATIDALVEADDAPLSIVIVGVGTGSDFQMMDELDGDGVNLRASNGRISRRDLVQFVCYRDFLPPKPREALAAEVLREIPDQFEDYLMLASQRVSTVNQMNKALQTTAATAPTPMTSAATATAVSPAGGVGGMRRNTVGGPNATRPPHTTAFGDERGRGDQQTLMRRNTIATARYAAPNSTASAGVCGGVDRLDFDANSFL